MTIRKNRGIGGGARRVLVLALSAAPLLTACDTDRFLQVSAPSKLPADGLAKPEAVPLLVNGAIADFECAFGNFALVEGVVSDELADAQLGAAGYDYDRRTVNLNPSGPYGTTGCASNQIPGIYVGMSTARWSADNALKAAQALPAEFPRRDSLIATSALYAGFGYTMLGMSMCEASIDLSAPKPQSELFAMAEEKFDLAIQTAQGKVSNVYYAALVGRARVRLYQGNKSGADADAKLVPAGFRFDAEGSDTNNRRYNRMFASGAKYGYYTVAPSSRDLTTEGVVDPRSAVHKIDLKAMDDRQTMWVIDKYTSENSPIRVASYDEAQLIMAEAEGGAAAVSIINALRTRYGVPTYTGATDAAAIQKLIADERLRTLFGEGFRNYDVQRFQLPFVPAEGTPFKDGAGTYGNTTCMPLPNSERFNNPNV